MDAIINDKNISIWSATVLMPSYPTLLEDITVDVCVVGGGIGGLSTAYLLQKEGKKVCILESLELGSGQTGRTTAHFSNALDDRYFNLEKYHGQEGARLAAVSHTEAIKKVAQIIQDEKIDCDFEYLNGYLFSSDEDTENTLEKEHAACLRTNILEVLSVDSLPIKDFPKTDALCFLNQAQLHPLKYLKRIAELINERGGEIYTHTLAEEMHGGKECYVKTKDGFRITCQSIVVATNTPVNDRLAIHTKQYPYRTYAMAFRIPEGKMQKALFWDTEDPYHYIRLESNDIMIVGGEDHKTGQESYPESRFQKLETWVRSHFSFAGELLYRWSGQVMEPMDGLGYLGHNPVDFDNVYIITGDSGNGMTHCTIGAMLITDQIMGRKNRWEELYKPSRISLRASSTFLKENLNVAAQYVDWVTTESKDSLEDLSHGEGRVFRQGTQFIAAYKNDTGDYQTMTAVCPHLGGIVTWNSVEKSWDCPCHGSRFDCHGKVIEGPALSDLKRVDFEEPAMVAEHVGFNKIPYSSGEISPV